MDPDYDYDAWEKAGSPRDPQTGHMPDTYKLPNHPTFSDESIYHGKDGNYGGHWTESDDREAGPNKSWIFTPGPTNLQHHSKEELQDYFNRVEPGNRLDLSPGYEEEEENRWKMSPRQLREEEANQPPVGRALRPMPQSEHIEDRTITPRNMVRSLHNLPMMRLLDTILPR